MFLDEPTCLATKLQSGPPILDGVREIGRALVGRAGRSSRGFLEGPSMGPPSGRVDKQKEKTGWQMAAAREEAGAFCGFASDDSGRG